MAGSIFRYFIYSNLFIAICAVMMVYQTEVLLLHGTSEFPYLGFVFSGTLTSYSFHWYFTPATPGNLISREHWLFHHRRLHAILFFPSLGSAIFFALLLKEHWYWLLLAAAISFLYSAPKVPHPFFKLLRRIAIGKTIFLAMAWVFVTAIVPLKISEAQWKPEFSLFIAGRFFLIYAICILFDFRDRDFDKALGIRSLITLMNKKSIIWLLYASLFVYAMLTLMLFHYGQSPVSIAVLMLPGTLTAAISWYALRNFSDILYYFVLDGMMAFSAYLTFFMNVIS